jgi:DNA (cytosine-5)-methyltransferase 1
VEWRELRACDFGAPTIRKRLFLVARCDAQPIVWPEPTHGPGRAHPHRAAAECIDWSIPCPSIFERRRPLAEKTLRRIARGIRKFVIDAAEPFIVPVSHGGDLRAHSIREPLRTVTAAHRGEHALVVPSIVSHYGESVGRNVSAPIPTGGGGHQGLVAATLQHSGNGERPGQDPRVYDLRKPLSTVVAEGQKHALVSAFLARHYGGHGNDGTSLRRPTSTVTARDHQGLAVAHLNVARGSNVSGRPIDEPAPTVTAHGTHLAEVRAFLTRYNGQGEGQPAQLPIGTVVTKDRFGLVTVHGVDYEIADIGLRMLQPRELYRAQGFPDSYVIDVACAGKPLTKEAQIRMCGNAVPPQFVAAILGANPLEERVAA